MYKRQAEGYEVSPEIEIPLVMDKNELAMLRQVAEDVADEVMAEKGAKISYTIGTMKTKHSGT